MLRGLIAGVMIGAIAPLIGIFLVLRRYSLIADTLAHVSLAGVAVGLILQINPLLTAVGAATLSSLAIERLRQSKRVYGESALSLFLSGSLAVAVILIGLAHGFNVDLFSYLFGSIVTVRASDVNLILGLGLVVITIITLLYRQLVYTTFDIDAAHVAGIKTQAVNFILILLASLTVALSIPVLGVLLVSALIVIPVTAALQLKHGFIKTLVLAEAFSISTVIVGILASFYLNVPAGGTIVLLSVIIFGICFVIQRK